MSRTAKWMAIPVGFDGDTPIERVPREPQPRVKDGGGVRPVRCPVCRTTRFVAGDFDHHKYVRAADGVHERRCLQCRPTRGKRHG